MAFVKTLTMTMSTVTAHDSINLNAQCADGREGGGGGGREIVIIIKIKKKKTRHYMSDVVFAKT